MTAYAVPEALGLEVTSSQPFSGTASAARAGSTHYTLRSGVYEFWCATACLVFVTAAGGANDPPAVPVVQGAGLGQTYPGAFIPAGVVFRFRLNRQARTTLSGGLAFAPTGIRVVALDGTTPAFYLNEYRRITSWP